jgi:hypothetical protein
MIIQSIASKYGVLGETADEIRAEIKREMAPLHPDKNGMKFVSPEAEARYHQLNEAKAEIAAAEVASKSLVPVSAIRDIVELINTNKAVDSKAIYESKLEAAIKDTTYRASKRGFVPKIGITAVTTVLTFLWLFPKTVEEHPVLKHYVDVTSKDFTAFWFLSVTFCATYWLGLYYVNMRKAETMANLKLEQHQNDLFEIFKEAKSRRSDFEEQHKHFRFTKADFISFLTSGEWRDVVEGLPRYKSRSIISFLRGSGGRIDSELATSLADLIFDRAERNGVIATSGERALSTRYKLIGGDNS